MSKKMKRAMIVAAILIGGFVALSGDSYSEDDFTFETYTVKSGDTFWDVSHYYREKDARNLYIFDYQDELRDDYVQKNFETLECVNIKIARAALKQTFCKLGENFFVTAQTEMIAPVTVL